MNKDLHSGKVEKWNIIICWCYIFITYGEGDKLRVKSGCWFHHGLVRDMGRQELPKEIRVKDGKLTWKRMFSGSEYEYDDRGNLIWERGRDGNEYRYEDSNVIWKKFANGKERRYDKDGNVVWQKNPDGEVVTYG